MMLPYPIFIRQGHFSGLVLLICLFSALWFWRSNPARILRIKMVWYLFFSFSVDGLQPITSSHHHIQAQHNLSKKVQIRIQSPVPPLTFFQHSFCTPKMVSVWGWQRSWVLQWSASAMACSAERSKGSGRTSAVGAGPSQPAWLQKKLHLRTRHRGEENICQFTVQVINQCWITESKHCKTLGRGAEHFVDSWHGVLSQSQQRVEWHFWHGWRNYYWPAGLAAEKNQPEAPTQRGACCDWGNPATGI